MLPFLDYALSAMPPTAAEREELARLYPRVDARWHQKMDRALLVVTVRDAGALVAAGIVHDSVVAPTELMDAVELGCMVVAPRYRRMGIRQRVAEMRLAHALDAGRTAITVIHAANPASWAFYERSELWALEREYEFDGQGMFIYQATAAARDWANSLPLSLGTGQPSLDSVPVQAQDRVHPVLPTITVPHALGCAPCRCGSQQTEHDLHPAGY